MDPIEVAGVAFGLWSVWLTIKERISSWPVGIVNIVLFMILFFSVKLYADFGLQIVFLVLSVYGWWVWLHPRPGKQEVPVTLLPTRVRVGALGASVSATFAMGFLLSHYTDAALPFWDSTTTVLSVVAQYLMARKNLECWYLWISADVLYVGIYAYKDLFLTSGLYAIFLVLAISGLLRWRKSWLRTRTA